MLESDGLFYKSRERPTAAFILAEMQEEQEAILDEGEEIPAVFLTSLMAACELP